MSAQQVTLRRRSAKGPLAKIRAYAGPTAIHLFAATVLIVSAIVVVRFLRQQVQARITFINVPPAIMIKDRPVWMSDALARQICDNIQPIGLHNAFDHDLLVQTAQLLSNNPWVRQVRQVRRVFVRRPGDTLEIDCDFRAPIALVHWQNYFWLVDGQGFKLPEQFNADQIPRIILGSDHHTNIRIIDGVAHAPVESGQRWPGQDLAAGLDLVKLLYGKPYADDAIKIDVTNYNGRIDRAASQIVFLTRYGSEIRWGRPLNSADFFAEVPAEQKLDAMERIFNHYGRLDANHEWIDIRFDRVTYPSAGSQNEADAQATPAADTSQ